MHQRNRRQWIGQTGGILGFPMVGDLFRQQPGTGRSGPARIKVGQIGVGHAHASKLSVYRQSDDYEVVGIVEPDERLRAEAQLKPVYRGLPWLTREQLLNQKGLSAVLVETRVRDLLDTAEACVNAGLFVHLDKPAGGSLLQYRRILETASRKALWVQMGYMYRYNPGVTLLREVLERGWLGEVFEVHTVMSKVLGPAERAALVEYRGGIMFELGCHVIDLVVGIMGAPTKVTPFARHSSKRDDGLLDNMLAVFEYPNATATVKSSALEVEGMGRRHLVVCGTEGTFQIQALDNPSVRVAFAAAHGDYPKGYQTVSLPKFTRYVADAADMARVIRQEQAIPFGRDHDLAVQSALLQASAWPGDI